ncbi:MerR family transcriptional regulator [Crossiella sp. CA198]|uniref:MerR family transcriptional regulator n=1 Tax=Crossiella sp. CA198 TaxID=3455607 RepID=UPI003F8D71A7
MLIGELAEVGGGSTRAIRYYHQIGLLPEPARLANRYRSDTVRDAVRLARIRQLTELGLTLAEARDALAEDEARSLANILARLEADLDREERELRDRRRRLRRLLDRDDATTSEPISELSQLIQDAFPYRAATRETATTSPCWTAAPPQSWPRCRSLLADPRLVTHLRGLCQRFDEISEAESEDPRVTTLAADLLRLLPTELTALIRSPALLRHPLADATARGLPPAHAQLLKHLFESWRAPGRVQPPRTPEILPQQPIPHRTPSDCPPVTQWRPEPNGDPPYQRGQIWAPGAKPTRMGCGAEAPQNR